MLTEKKYGIYYREIPLVLEAHINKDKNMKYVKDGLKTYDGDHKCPRLSLVVSPCGNDDEDKKRLKSLEQLLDRLETNNQIIGYSG